MKPRENCNLKEGNDNRPVPDRTASQPAVGFWSRPLFVDYDQLLRTTRYQEQKGKKKVQRLQVEGTINSNSTTIPIGSLNFSEFYSFIWAIAEYNPRSLVLLQDSPNPNHHAVTSLNLPLRAPSWVSIQNLQP